jgi:hypothetical protein
MGPEELAPLLRRTVDTIKTDARRRPESLPPRLQIPGSKRLVWLEQDVVDWINRCRVTKHKSR